MKLSILAPALLILLVAGCSQESTLLQEAPVVRQPQSVHFITSDIPLFWAMYDREKPLFTASELTKEYFDVGTPALSVFLDEKLRSVRSLSTLLNSRLDRKYYESIRPQTLRIQEQKKPTVKAMEKFQQLYPKAVFPDIVFLIGALNDGGVLLRNGQVVVAAEMFSKSSDTDISYLSPWLQRNLETPKFIPVIILHELVHVQQRKFALEHKLPVGGKTLLDRAIMEGAADFITHLVLDQSINGNLLSYADPKEGKLWHQFQKKMNKQDYTGWLYNGNNQTGRPADLGYYIGYKICQAYYQKSPNKGLAIQHIIEMKNGQAFLKQSGYAQKF